MSSSTEGRGREGVLDDGRTAEVVEDQVPDGSDVDGRRGVLDDGETSDVVEAGEGEPTKGP